MKKIAVIIDNTFLTNVPTVTYIKKVIELYKEEMKKQKEVKE